MTQTTGRVELDRALGRDVIDELAQRLLVFNSRCEQLGPLRFLDGCDLATLWNRLPHPVRSALQFSIDPVSDVILNRDRRRASVLTLAAWGWLHRLVAIRQICDRLTGGGQARQAGALASVAMTAGGSLVVCKRRRWTDSIHLPAVSAQHDEAGCDWNRSTRPACWCDATATVQISGIRPPRALPAGSRPTRRRAGVIPVRRARSGRAARICVVDAGRSDSPALVWIATIAGLLDRASGAGLLAELLFRVGGVRPRPKSQV